MSSFGHNRERQIKRHLESEGYVVTRAPASLGTFDLMAAKPGDLMLVEVKATAAGPFHGFGPADREALIATAARAGATPVLAWWPKRKQLRMIPVSEWP